MLDKIQGNFKKELQLTHLAALLNHLGNMFHILQTQNMNSTEAKNDALDLLSALINQQKEPVIVQPQSTTAPA